MKNETNVLVLQGGGALGAYQAGAYQALAEDGYEPDWVAGISIGAINAAIIAGNTSERRVQRLREFWELVSSRFSGQLPNPLNEVRSMFNEASAMMTAGWGVPGFFKPRFPPAPFMPSGTKGALSFYDTGPLRKTLEELVDFDLLNTANPRLSVESVNVTTGNSVYFDTRDMTIGPEHIMASGALPPGFPPVEIDEHIYWDGGLVTNTPLQYVLNGGDGPREDMCVFQIDLFSARGPAPTTILEVEERAKDIRFSSRTRLNTDRFREMQIIRRAARKLYDKLPDDLKSDPDAGFLEQIGCEAAVTIVQLINRQTPHHLHSKDYEFSRVSMEDHWKAGQGDVSCTLNHTAWRNRTRPETGVEVFDLCRSDVK